MGDIKQQLGQILTQDIFLAVYRLKFPYPKRRLPSGAVVGKAHFRPEYGQRLYDLIYRDVLIPMSKLPLESLLAVDMSTFLPQPDATDYPEQSLGLVTILDQTRMLTAGYNFRYTRAFFDPICEKLCRQLICLPLDVRPDGKNAWLSRGYSLDDWLVRTLWFWAPLVHSDDFMVKDRQTLKDYLHAIRAEVEAQARRADPVAPLENQDDKDINAFKTIETDGPPQRSYADSASEATVSEFSTQTSLSQICAVTIHIGSDGEVMNGTMKIETSWRKPVIIDTIQRTSRCFRR